MRKSKNRYFYHIFVSPGDAPGVITLNVVRMEREFDAYKLSRSIYPSIFNSFPDIRTASAKNAIFTYGRPHFCFPWDAPGAITLNVVRMERVFDAYKLSRSIYPSIFNSFPDIRTANAKNAIFTYRRPHFCFPWRRPCDYHAIWCMDGKTIQCLPNTSQHVPICLQ